MAPSAIVIATAAGQGTPYLPTISTKRTPRSAMTDPTERSMPPVMMTNPWPIANMPNNPTRLAVFPRLIGDRKSGLRR